MNASTWCSHERAIRVSYCTASVGQLTDSVQYASYCDENVNF